MSTRVHSERPLSKWLGQGRALQTMTLLTWNLFVTEVFLRAAIACYGANARDPLESAASQRFRKISVIHRTDAN
jgi:hypothetical protein